MLALFWLLAALVFLAVGWSDPGLNSGWIFARLFFAVFPLFDYGIIHCFLDHRVVVTRHPVKLAWKLAGWRWERSPQRADLPALVKGSFLVHEDEDPGADAVNLFF